MKSYETWAGPVAPENRRIARYSEGLLWFRVLSFFVSRLGNDWNALALLNCAAALSLVLYLLGVVSCRYVLPWSILDSLPNRATLTVRWSRLCPEEQRTCSPTRVSEVVFLSREAARLGWDRFRRQCQRLLARRHEPWIRDLGETGTIQSCVEVELSHRPRPDRSASLEAVAPEAPEGHTMDRRISEDSANQTSVLTRHLQAVGGERSGRDKAA